MIRVLAVTVTLASLGLAQRPARAQNVDAVVDRVAEYWARGDASSIASLAARDGVSLDLDGRTVGPLSGRQTTAMLRRLFEERQTINVRKMSAHIVGGRPSRASGEISWMMRSRGTTIPEKTSVFIALVLEDDRWRVTEIRFVRP